MVKPRTLLVAALVTLGLAAAAPACGGLKSATGACTERCDKAETCGDIDSVNAQQCRNKCDANAEVADAYLELCLNKSDILAAESECLGRACTDYAACLSTVPGCKATGYTGTGGSYTGPGTYTGTYTYTGTGTYTYSYTDTYTYSTGTTYPYDGGYGGYGGYGGNGGFDGGGYGGYGGGYGGYGGYYPDAGP
jgi:hypothetical protein